MAVRVVKPLPVVARVVKPLPDAARVVNPLLVVHLSLAEYAIKSLLCEFDRSLFFSVENLVDLYRAMYFVIRLSDYHLCHCDAHGTLSR